MISEQADENAIIIWGAALDEEMEDAISVIVIATGFPTQEAYAPIVKRDDKKPASPFQYGAAPVKPEPSRFGAVTRPQDQRPQPKPAAPAYNPFAPQPQAQPQAQQPAAPVYPNANTSAPAPQSRPQQSKSSSGDSDDSYMDIISLFNNN